MTHRESNEHLSSFSHLHFSSVVHFVVPSFMCLQMSPDCAQSELYVPEAGMEEGVRAEGQVLSEGGKETA